MTRPLISSCFIPLRVYSVYLLPQTPRIWSFPPMLLLRRRRQRIVPKWLSHVDTLRLLFRDVLFVLVAAILQGPPFWTCWYHKGHSPTKTKTSRFIVRVISLFLSGMEVPDATPINGMESLLLYFDVSSRRFQYTTHEFITQCSPDAKHSWS